MKKVHGVTKNIDELLRNKKFSIGYFQREYRWEERHIRELIDDLSDNFSNSYKNGHERTMVEDYDHYFLGSIVVSDKDGKKVIIDGQQRLTSLTLILIYIYHQIEDAEKGSLHDLILSRKYGKQSFNLDIKERDGCMNALFNESEFEEKNELESVNNILRRYENIKEYFPEELKGESLLCFMDWLLEKVHLVEITSYSDTDAYTIFETMNDRGLPLTITDKFKGYLLSKIESPGQREMASIVWRDRILGLREGVDARFFDLVPYFIRSWLIGQFAETFSDKDTGGVWPFEDEANVARGESDFAAIGRADFYRWIRDNRKRLNLTNSNSFVQFIVQDAVFYGDWYIRITDASKSATKGLEIVNLTWGDFSLPVFSLLFASLDCKESKEENLRRLRIIARYVDISLARYSWNQNINFPGFIFGQMMTSPQLIIDIRRRPAPELVEILIQRLNAEKDIFASNAVLRSDTANKRGMRRLLARITHFVETSSGKKSRYKEYSQHRDEDDGYQIEHIWANQPRRHRDEFADPTEFSEYRNRIGGLLLLPNAFNASYGDKPYNEKLEHYYGQNLLAQSLHKRTYENNPGFIKFIKESKLPFKAHPEFKKADLDARQELYRAIAKKIWDPETLRFELEN